MKDHCDFDCDDHADMVPHVKHPDGEDSKHNKHLHEGARGAVHPQHHTSGKMPAQMNPDHGPHHHDHYLKHSAKHR